jgi:hypothetical protein
MALASPAFDRPDPRDRRVLGFLLLSLLLHILWLALPLSRQASLTSVRPLPALAVHLARPEALHEVATGQPLPKPAEGARSAHPRALETSRPEAAATAHTKLEPASPQERQGTGINLETAFAAARSIAKDTKAAPSALGSPTLPLTVETAVAKATRPDVVVESRGANGEWVTQDRKSRCVARIQRKWFEEGVPMLTLCEVKKG